MPRILAAIGYRPSRPLSEALVLATRLLVRLMCALGVGRLACLGRSYRLRVARACRPGGPLLSSGDRMLGRIVNVGEIRSVVFVVVHRRDVLGFRSLGCGLGVQMKIRRGMTDKVSCAQMENCLSRLAVP